MAGAVFNCSEEILCCRVYQGNCYYYFCADVRMYVYVYVYAPEAIDYYSHEIKPE